MATSLPASSHAQAAEPPWVDLRWSAPAACPTENDVLREIGRLLGDRAARPAAPAQVSATVEERDGRFEVHLEMHGESGDRARDLRGASCAAIADATALILAMMIDPSAVEDAPEPLPEPPVETPESAIVPESPVEAPAPPPSTPVSTPVSRPVSTPVSTPPAASFSVAAFAGADVGSLPGISGRVGLSARVSVGDQHFELAAALAPGSTQTLSDRADAGGDVSLVTGSLGSCRRLLKSPIEVAPCLAFELGSLSATGFGVTSPGEGSALWAAAVLGVEAGYPLFAGLSLSSRLEAALPLSRPRFVLDGAGAVHRPSAAAGRLSIGLALGF